MTDPIADMLTRIRNAQMMEKPVVRMSASRLKKAIADVLKDEGYIEGYEVVPALADKGKTSSFSDIVVNLKYYANRPVIEKIVRYSRQGLRQYSGWEDLPRPSNGLGICIVSTSKGIMSDRRARQEKIGGEVLCTVY